MRGEIRHWLAMTLFSLTLTACGSPSVDDLLESAAELREQGRYESATAEYRQVLQEEPDNAEARFGLGHVQLLSGEYRRAVVALRRAQDLGIDPDRVQPLLARALLWSGEHEQLIEEIDPESVSDQRSRAEVLAYVGRAHLHAERHQDARSALDDALAMDGDSVPVLVSLSRLALAQEQHQEAADYAERALDADRDSSAARFARGDAARGLADDETAVAHYEAGLDGMTPDVSVLEAFNARGRLAQALLGLDRMAEAKEHVEVMRRQASRHPYPNYLAGIIALREGDLSTATERGQTMLAAAPDSIPGKLLMGTVRLEQGQYAQAVRHLQDVVSADPENAEAQALLMSALRGAGHEP